MMEKTDNYQISRDRAKTYFLNFDQESFIRRWKLSHDEDTIWVTFLGRSYAVSRSSGGVTRCDGSEAEYSEVLSVFDLLCHEGQEKWASHRYAPVNSLRGRPPVGVGTDFNSKIASKFDAAPEAFRRACLALGGMPVDMGDMGFRFPLFGELQVILKFYRADEDFPASITLLWDENMLQFVFYETVFYIAGVLLHAIGTEMRKVENL